MPLLPLLPVQIADIADWARMVPLYPPFVRVTDGRSVVVSGRWSPADIWTLELQTRDREDFTIREIESAY